jgi:protein-tyrosine phosphatase
VFFFLEEKSMSRASHSLSTLLLGAALVCSLAGLACEHHYYRVYDPYYTDYHVWNNDEVTYYHRWADETHRDPNRDFRKLPKDEQKEYWTWRHNHGDHDHH